MAYIINSMVSYLQLEAHPGDGSACSTSVKAGEPEAPRTGAGCQSQRQTEEKLCFLLLDGAHLDR